jgi:type IV pilus assembly protein PilQ
MDTRLSALRVWGRLLLAGAVLPLALCATAMAAAPVPTPGPNMAAAPPPAVSAPRGPIEVTGVAVKSGGQSGVTVVVTADGPVATYESFTLPDPPRVVLDIPNAIHAVPQPIPASPPTVTAIRSSQYRERPVKIVRLVLDLRSAVPYQVETRENQLLVQLGVPGESQPSAQAPASSTPLPGVPAAALSPTGKVTRVGLQNVRGRQRIVITTSGRVSYTVNETSEPPGLTVDVTGATIDPSAARTLDLRQVASPVSRLQASQYRTQPDQVVRVVADLRNPTRYEVQKTGSTILVELQAAPRTAAPPAAPTEGPAAPATPAPTVAVPPTPPAGPGNGRLSMDFKDADINNLLRIIAEVSGMNVVSGSDVSGRVTVRLVNVDWQQALDVILKINNMGYELDGNIIRVAPLAKLAAERKMKEDQKRAEEDARLAAVKRQETEQQFQKAVEPLETEVIAVNYAKAGDVVKNLDRLKTMGRPDTSIAVDDRTNKLIIKETRGTLDKMVQLLKQLDLPTPQVLIEARLVEAQRNFAQSLGIEWGFAANINAPNLQSQPVSVFGSPVGTPLVPTPAPGGGVIPLAVSLPASSPTIGVGLVANNLFSNRLAIQARISAAENDGKAKTLSAPRVATLDNQEAEIKQGTQVPYTTVDSSGRTVVAFQDAFIRLKVTPHITNDRRVSMKVEAERTDPGTQINFTGGFAFPLNTRKATTNVLVSNGGTIVIGGLLQTTDNEAETGVPWLSKVPVLGWMFKSDSMSKTRIELLIFLTPTILEEPRLS